MLARGASFPPPLARCAMWKRLIKRVRPLDGFELPHAGRRTYDFIERLIGELPNLELVLGSASDDLAMML
jgi:hypothetical protein